MAKYHLNYKGEAGRCTAEVGKCPFGNAEDHFPTPEAAREAYEAAHEAFGSAVKAKPKAGPEDVLRYERIADNLGGRITVEELAEADGFDGADAAKRVSDFKADRVVAALNARAVADANPNSMGDEIEAQHLEQEAGLRPKARPAVKKTAARPAKAVEHSWEDGKTPAPADSKLILPPAVNNPTGGYMGGRLWRGGKVPDEYQGQKAAAKLIRADVRAAVKAGELPSDLEYSVRMASGSWVTSIDIYVARKGILGKLELTQEELEDPRMRAVFAYLDALGNQYSTDDSNGMVDYFNSHNRARVERWHKYL